MNITVLGGLAVLPIGVVFGLRPGLGDSRRWPPTVKFVVRHTHAVPAHA
jgi:hypothetical protein